MSSAKPSPQNRRTLIFNRTSSEEDTSAPDFITARVLLTFTIYGHHGPCTPVQIQISDALGGGPITNRFSKKK